MRETGKEADDVDIIYSFKEEKLYIPQDSWEARAVVPMKTLKNGLRAADNVARTIPGELPYDPEPFPLGTWIVSEIRDRKDPYRAPFFIATSAYRKVRVWKLDERGRYLCETDRTAIDQGYGIHYSEHPTTQGCIKVVRKEDLEDLVKRIKAEWAVDFRVRLLVGE